MCWDKKGPLRLEGHEDVPDKAARVWAMAVGSAVALKT